MKATILCLLSAAMLCTACKKSNDTATCAGKSKPTGKFIIKEVLRDTAFIADTIFRNNLVQFGPLDAYESVTWQLGADPRNFTNPIFSLSFSTALGDVPISFTGRKTPDPYCFPGDNGNYTSVKTLTVLEQADHPDVTISPLAGRYKGYFTNAPNDTFTVRMNYFDSAKYDVSVTGSKNFYWLSNIPDGYVSSLGWSYPELKNGHPVEMGYKCFQFGSSTDMIQGRGWLSHDTLFISYGNDIVGRKKFIGKKL